MSKTQSVEGKMWVTRQYRKAGREVSEEMDEQQILVDTFETAHATASATMSMTMNMGNYESMRIEVGVSLPCYKEEIEEAQEQCFKLVEEKLYQKVRAVKESL